MRKQQGNLSRSPSIDLNLCLSQAHAQIYIKDVKSSNGTFINGERLSPEAVESDVFELHNNDMIEFGIDITSEETKSIVHRKVAARCFLVMSAEDAVATSRLANTLQAILCASLAKYIILIQKFRQLLS